MSDLFGSGTDRTALLAAADRTRYQRRMRTRALLAALVATAALGACAGPALAAPTATKITLQA
ncbi:MAG: hypothetical protein ABI317_16385, partial [Gaiellales bacterium]